MLRAVLTTCARALPLLAAAVAVTAAGGQEVKPSPNKGLEKAVKNKNALIEAFRDKLILNCSSAYDGWPVERLIDGDPARSWFSGTGDSAAKGTKPWVEIAFPEDVKVSRVTVLGNREPPYEKNYHVLTGTIDFLDRDGKRLWSEEVKGAGDAYDFEFKPKKPVEKVRSVKFTSVKDEGDQNDFGDVALGEIQIE
jgi:hypothetical protein